MAEDDQDNLEVFKALENESKEFDKDAEIDRILNAFRLDAYAVLDLQPGIGESDIKKTYRTKSLLIHPDKTSNARAPDAFDRLRKAHSELLDSKHRERLDEAIADARMLLIRERKWTVDHEALTGDAFRADWRRKTQEVLVEAELRRRRQMKVQLQEEGRARQKEDDEIEARKRKREEAEKWEDGRDKRIGDWRSFQKGKKDGEEKKKKKKLKVLA